MNIGSYAGWSTAGTRGMKIQRNLLYIQDGRVEAKKQYFTFTYMYKQRENRFGSRHMLSPQAGKPTRGKCSKAERANLGQL